MPDDSSTDGKRRGRRGREETPWIETIAGELRVWRDQGTNEIVIEQPVSAPANKSGRRIALSTRDARHLANSLLLFAAETESNGTVVAAMLPIHAERDK